MSTQTEFEAGYNSGRLHWKDEDNQRKMRQGIRSDEPLIKAYWEGYLVAFLETAANNLEQE